MNINLQVGNCIELLKKLPPKSVHQIFADPPYNLSGTTFQTVQSGKMVTCDKGE